MLFNDTILHNVSYGRPGAPLEDVIAAAEAAQLDAAIARMPHGAIIARIDDCPRPRLLSPCWACLLFGL